MADYHSGQCDRCGFDVTVFTIAIQSTYSSLDPGDVELENVCASCIAKAVMEFGQPILGTLDTLRSTMSAPVCESCYENPSTIHQCQSCYQSCPNCGEEGDVGCTTCRPGQGCANCGSTDETLCSDCYPSGNNWCSDCGEEEVYALCSDCREDSGAGFCHECGDNDGRLLCHACRKDEQRSVTGDVNTDGSVTYDDGVTIQFVE